MKLLALFAHPDDELGCVGTLRKHAARGDEVLLVWTTYGELASQFAATSEAEVRRIRQKHGESVARKLGATPHFFDLGDSRMTGARHEALELARLYARFKPDAVLTWSDDHPHPDHRNTAKIAFDAVTLARIPKIINEDAAPGDAAQRLEPHRKPLRFYQYPSRSIIRPYVHVDISEHIGLVGELFSFYRDFYDWPISTETFLQSRALNGRESGAEYAEKFQLRQDFLPARAYL